MAGRQNKVGLDYFELDCHMDEKVELIEAEYGLKGFAILVKLYQSIYSGFGYYCEWTPDISVLWARRLGVSHSVGIGDVGRVDDKSCALPGFPNNLINNVVSALIRRNIFSETLFKKYGILTSSGVQKQYLKATSKREVVDLKKEYLLISIPQNRNNVVVNSIFGVRNSISSIGNKQSRVKKSREEYISPVTRFEDFWSVYPKQRNRMPAEAAYCKTLLSDVHMTEDTLITAAGNYAEACKVLGTEERYIKNPDRWLLDNTFVDYLAGRYKKPQAKSKGSKFNQFQQNEYDFEALERDLIEN